MTDSDRQEDGILKSEFDGDHAAGTAPQHYHQQQQRPETEIDRIRARQAMEQQQQL